MRAGKAALPPGSLYTAAALLLLLSVIVIPTLTRDIWVDEFHTLETLGAPPLFELRSISGVVTFMAEEDLVNPPGYFVLLALWGRLAGWSLPVLRSLSLFAGLLALALLFHLARRNFSLPVALLALIFTGFNVASLHMLSDMRSYMLLQLAVTLMLVAWTNLINARRTSPTAFALLLFSLALVPWIHYFGLYAVLALALCHLLLALRRRRFWLVTGCFAAAGVLFLPWVEVVVRGLQVERSGAGNLAVNAILHHPLELTRQVLEHFSNGNEGLMIFFAGLALFGVRARLPWLWTLLALGLPLALGNLFPVLRLRYLFYLWPGLGLLAAIGGDRLRRVHPAALVLPAMWVLALLWQIAPQTQGPFRDLIFHGMRPPYNSVLRQLQGLTLPEDVLVWHRNESRVDHANQLLGQMLVHTTSPLSLARRSLLVAPAQAPPGVYLRSRDEAFSEADRVWLAWEKEHRHWRLGPLTEDWLPQQGYRRCNVLKSPEEPVRVELWAQVPGPDAATIWRFGDGAGREVRLQPGEPSPMPTGAGQHYTIFWESGLPHGYSAGLYRLDANGGLQAQLDVGLEGEHGCHGGTLAGAPAPGDSLWLGVYDWRSGVRLTPLDVEGEHHLARID